MSDALLGGFKTLLMGPAGTGKTHAIGTLVDQGLDVFVLMLENGLESLLGYYRDRGQEIPPNLHWHRIKVVSAGFAELEESVASVRKFDQATVAKMGDKNRKNYNGFETMLAACNDFVDDRTGEHFGDVSTWSTDRVVVLDSLTSVNKHAMTAVTGTKPVKSQADWQIAQNFIEYFFTQLCENCECHAVVIAHMSREVDEVMGGVKLTVATLGKALAPRLPSLFSDVIMAEREGKKYYWNTASAQADLKTRNLEVDSKLPPDFAQIVTSWKRRAEA